MARSLAGMLRTGIPIHIGCAYNSCWLLTTSLLEGMYIYPLNPSGCILYLSTCSIAVIICMQPYGRHVDVIMPQEGTPPRRSRRSQEQSPLRPVSSLWWISWHELQLELYSDVLLSLIRQSLDFKYTDAAPLLHSSPTLRSRVGRVILLVTLGILWQIGQIVNLV